MIHRHLVTHVSRPACKAPFPASIPACKPATITLYVYGGSNQEDKNGKISQFDVPVSVNASPLTNRASWIQPSYDVNLVGRSQLHYFPWITYQQPGALDTQEPSTFARTPGL